MDADVRGAYGRIDAWLREYGGARGRRGPVDAAAVEAVVDRPLPADLLALWELEVDDGYWLPPDGGFVLMAAAELLETREIWLRVAKDEPDEPERFVPELLPIASSGGGDGLVVDLREGAAYGTVHLWDHEVWGLRVPLWGGVAEMLEDVAEALESGGPVLLGHAENGGTEGPCIAVSDGFAWVPVREGP
ncbi:SMI1/KNR4 family protein [Spirillospora sp. NPDC029432]|uniref:SMI1/KNR4 family protein n=1 Tax=Spirillospora sp. NPDC029432 TaxID=3154599 RepID=UPI0034571BAD